MICRHHGPPDPCPKCAGMDVYKPEVYPCTAGEMRKKLCLDGHDCWCLKEVTKVTGNDNQFYEFDGATCFADLSDHMSFNQGNIMKAVLRWDNKPDLRYNLEKIIYYAERELAGLPGLTDCFHPSTTIAGGYEQCDICKHKWTEYTDGDSQ